MQTLCDMGFEKTNIITPGKKVTLLGHIYYVDNETKGSLEQLKEKTKQKWKQSYPIGKIGSPYHKADMQSQTFT